VLYPCLGGWVCLGEEAPGWLPQVFEYVNEVDDDGDRYVAGAGLGGDPVDLMVVAVDERDRGAGVGGSRCWASAKIWATTLVALSTTLATSHLLVVSGPGAGSAPEPPPAPPVAGRMSAGVRTAGVMS